jgi:membrane-associated protease RseP (regulator of RpoE activity)
MPDTELVPTPQHFAAVPSPPATRPRRRRDWLLPLSLFLTTVATVTFAGACWRHGIALDSLAELGGLLRDPWLLAAGLPYAGLLLAILLAHELGHYFACRAHGIRSSLPYFLPGVPLVGTFGAVIRIRGPIPDRNALFDVAAAGPIAGFVVAFPVLVAGLLRAVPITGSLPPDGAGTFGTPLVSLVFERWWYGTQEIGIDFVYFAAWIGMVVTSLNLFPVGQLDGGHAVYAVSRRAHRVLARATLAALVVLVAYQAFVVRIVPSYVLWLVVLSVLRDRHPRLLDELTPLSRGRRVLAAGLALLFVLTFIPVPLRMPLSGF